MEIVSWHQERIKSFVMGCVEYVMFMMVLIDCKGAQVFPHSVRL
jgi:hypothetical protein